MFNHTFRKESTSTFFFHPTASAKETEPVKCVSEEEALLAFVDFLETVGHGVVLVGLDEETVDVLLQKLEAEHLAKFQSLVVGFTWWRRILAKTKPR